MKTVMHRLSDLQYERNEYQFKRGSFRVRGDTIDIFPAYMDYAIEVEFLGDNIKKIAELDPLTGNYLTDNLKAAVIYPAKHYMTDPNTYNDVFPRIRSDMEKQVEIFKASGKLIEAQRIEQRTRYDLEMIREVGYVNGIENYTRYFDGRNPGDPPYTLVDYFAYASKDWLLIIDESHITLPQIRGMYNGDRARKETLIDYGFRLPSALDNRPLRFDEFMRLVNKTIYVSATPDEYEISLATQDNAIVEQLIRPTGLIDPEVTIKPTMGQIPDLISEIQKRVEKKQRVLVTTLTKRMSEELTSYLEERGIKVAYLHSDIETFERQDILDKLREGLYDVVVGINLLREGLDLPEVSLVAILDADKEGFLRSRSSLIQTMGRAARHIDAAVIMYADKTTKSMQAAIDEVQRRRKIQLEYNKKHNITPKGIKKGIRAKLVDELLQDKEVATMEELSRKDVLLPDEKEKLIKMLRSEMKQAAAELDFETAAMLRDKITQLKR
jgi:excinuclease ABC subunit B